MGRGARVSAHSGAVKERRAVAQAEGGHCHWGTSSHILKIGTCVVATALSSSIICVVEAQNTREVVGFCCY